MDLYLAVPHYALGLGASRIHNWCWKDDAHRVFPWGMVYPCDGVPKPVAYAHRNQSLLFRHFSPVYVTPEVYVLTPDNHRLGGAKFQIIEGILNCIDIALSTHVYNLGVLNEHRLSATALKKAKVIYYPLPYCPSDEVCQKLQEWVQQGGTLYISGDISFEEQRQRSRIARLESLCGVTFQEEIVHGISINATNAIDQPCLQVTPKQAKILRHSEKGFPLLTENKIGQGHVFYNIDPVELHSTPERREKDVSTYKLVLAKAGIKPIHIIPDNSRIHVFNVPLEDGGKVFVLFNNDTNASRLKVTIQECEPPLTMTVALNRPALAWFDGNKRLRAIETQEECYLGTELFWKDSTDGILVSLDQRSILNSQALLHMPLKSGSFQLKGKQNWSQPVIETGDICNGLWNTFIKRDASRVELESNISIDSDQSRSLILITESGKCSGLRKTIEDSVLQPENIPLRN